MTRKRTALSSWGGAVHLNPDEVHRLAGLREEAVHPARDPAERLRKNGSTIMPLYYNELRGCLLVRINQELEAGPENVFGRCGWISDLRRRECRCFDTYGAVAMAASIASR
jgi:hypothetical protein